MTADAPVQIFVFLSCPGRSDQIRLSISSYKTCLQYAHRNKPGKSGGDDSPSFKVEFVWLYFAFEIYSSNIWRTGFHTIEAQDTFRIICGYKILFYGIHLTNLFTIATFGAICFNLSSQYLKCGEKSQKCA